jgi:hypothetical protein
LDALCHHLCELDGMDSAQPLDTTAFLIMEFLSPATQIEDSAGNSPKISTLVTLAALVEAKKASPAVKNE